MNSKAICMCVIPIVVRHKNSNKEIKTYAMLENCSQATFAKEHLLGLLGLQGRKTPITIKAMNGEVMKIYKATKSRIFQVGIWETLPSPYSQKDVPVNKSHKATAVKAS